MALLSALMILDKLHLEGSVALRELARFTPGPPMSRTRKILVRGGVTLLVFALPGPLLLAWRRPAAERRRIPD